MAKHCESVVEETTTGVLKLEEMVAQSELLCPSMNVTDWYCGVVVDGENIEDEHNYRDCTASRSLSMANTGRPNSQFFLGHTVFGILDTRFQITTKYHVHISNSVREGDQGRCSIRAKVHPTHSFCLKSSCDTRVSKDSR